MKKVIVIGAGLAGTTISRILAENNYQVELYERREHIGGNAYDYMDESKSYVHEYGPHIFHTNIEEVYSFLSKFTEWIPYEHKVLGRIDGQLVPIPFSLKSIDMLFSEEKAKDLKKLLISKYGENTKVTISKLRETKDEELSKLADYVYNKVFLNYTKKQWNLLPEQLGPEVTGRVPVYVSYDERYFQDKFQYMPVNGYTEMFKNMLNHKNINIHLNTDVMSKIEVKDNKIFFDGNDQIIFIYTGSIDELFNYKYGVLDYRSLRFEFETLQQEKFQPVAVVNYPNDNDFTRITEFKNFTVSNSDSKVTTIVREYPCKCEKNMIPYYPIPLKECEDKYQKYLDETKNINNLYLLGRLAQYKYYNMDLVVQQAIKMANKIIEGEK